MSVKRDIGIKETLIQMKFVDESAFHFGREYADSMRKHMPDAIYKVEEDDVKYCLRIRTSNTMGEIFEKYIILYVSKMVDVLNEAMRIRDEKMQEIQAESVRDIARALEDLNKKMEGFNT